MRFIGGLSVDHLIGEANDCKKLRTHLHQFFISKDTCALSCYAGYEYASD